MMMTTMAKCKKHPYEQGVGVCASCLRERLRELVAARSGLPHHAAQQQQSSSAPHSHQQLREQQLPRPLLFPRSVSPYISRRRSVDLDFHGDADADPASSRRQGLRFFSTPQVGAGAGRKRPAGGSFLASLFGGVQHSRSVEVEPDCVASGPTRGSSSWFSALLPGSRKKHQKKKNSRHFEEEAATENRARRKPRYRDRGISPAKDVDGGAEDDSESESGYSTESSGGCRIRAPTPMRKNFSYTHGAMSGFVVCLSPLVRAIPHRSQAGEAGGAAGMAGELRGTRGSSLRHHYHHHQRHRSGGGRPPTLGPSRSRKLADLGTFQ